MVQYFTLKEAAQYLEMSEAELTKLVKTKQIRAFQDRGTYRFRIQDVNELGRSRGDGADPDIFLGELAPAPKLSAGHIFISYVEEDGALAAEVAKGLERERYATWYYERDTLPGTDYLEATGTAIEKCQAVVLLISRHSLKKANQVTIEVVRAHECGKKFVPIRKEVSHGDFQKAQPTWRQALGASASIAVPEDGVAPIIAKIVGGLRHLGIEPGKVDVAEIDVFSSGPDSDGDVRLDLGSDPDFRLDDSDDDRPHAPPFSAGSVVHGRFRLQARVRTEDDHVYDSATDTQTKQEVVLKRLKCTRANFDHFHDRIRWEGEIVKTLQAAPLTPRFYGLYEKGNAVDLVLERLPPCLNPSKPQSVDRVRWWGLHICDLVNRLQKLTPRWNHIPFEADRFALLADGATLKYADFSGALPAGSWPSPKRQLCKKHSDVVVSTSTSPSPFATDDDIGALSANDIRLEDAATPKKAAVMHPYQRPPGSTMDADQKDLYDVAGTLYHFATGEPPRATQTAELIAKNLAAAKCPYAAPDRWFFQLIATVLADKEDERFESVEQFQSALEARRPTRTPAEPIPAVTITVPCPACSAANSMRDRNCVKCRAAIPYAPGKVLNQHMRIDKLIAKGGFSLVYLATDTRTGKPLVVKDMYCEDPNGLAVRLNFFRREAKVLGLFKNVKAVPKFVWYYEKNDVARIMLEHIPGQDLIDVMRANRGKPFPFDLIVEWGKTICDVLHALHTHNPPWIHRDLKPDQIMLLPDGKTIKLIDFGLAREAGKQGAEPATTRVSTHGYTAPEQTAGRALVRSDLFCLATTLFQLATGQVPEGTQTGLRLADALAAQTFPFPAEQRWFFELLRVNLSTDFHDRYFSVADFKADLERKQFTRFATCKKCKHKNPAREPFCSRCASTLTGEAPPCEKCGKANRLGARTCIACEAPLWY